jgi:acyl-coenzyme A thioesterase PaaI-like protein
MNFFKISGNTFKWIMALWPPFWFTGIRYEFVADDFRKIRVTMALRFYNKNIHGIQYGGNLFSMTDACHGIMLFRNLGPSYNVLDKSAHIEFVKPGKTKVILDCVVTEADIQDIKQKTANGEKYLKEFTVHVKDLKDEIVATVYKTVYVRKKRPK